MRYLTWSLLALVLVCSLGVFWGSYAYFKGQELAKAEARLSLLRGTVDAELQRFAHLPFMLSRDPFVIEAAQSGQGAELNARLADFASRAEIDAIYLMDDQGDTLSASNAGTPASFVGQNYSFRPYFISAITGEPGEFYGIGATTGIPGYFFAEPVWGNGQDIVGVIAIKIDLSSLQNSWLLAGEQIVLANSDGVTLLASDPAWRYRTLGPLNDTQRQTITEARQFGRESLGDLDWTPNPDAQTVEIGGDRYLYVFTDELPNGWSLHFFAPDEQALTGAWLTTGALLLFSGVMFIGLQVQRMRRIGAALRRSEDEEALLRSTNERLAIEIDERRTAEARLQKTKADLERAGRLAALGQLASSVTHELGQPIAAMRNHLAAAEIQGGQTALTERLQGLTDRMEGITRQLKFFSRKGRDKFEIFDLREAISGALDLMQPDLVSPDVNLEVDLPNGPTPVRANRLRIEQVVTNLVRNALDATSGQTTRNIRIALGQSDDHVWFEVVDNGHGLGDTSLEDLKEPFTTTRESGQGMGLGLTISAGILSDHKGELSARNAGEFGAVFRARLPSVLADGGDQTDYLEVAS